jgi:hypothetical protein
VGTQVTWKEEHKTPPSDQGSKNAFTSHKEKLEEIMRGGLEDGDLVDKVGIIKALPKDRSGVAEVFFTR